MAHVAPASSAAAPSETNRLETTFADSPVAAHGPRWHGLWKDSFTPWDRGGCSLALADTLISRPDLFPSRSSTARRERALVPGCGRGHDVLLLAALGYDVVGLDFSTAAIQAAQENARTPENVALYTAMGDTVKGNISWIAGDFFSDEWWSSVGKEPFHLIFDYTFLCALPPNARPQWAKRMAELLSPDGGRLVCLEWPLHKDPGAAGPPWGLTADTYTAHLLRPGESVTYGRDGRVSPEALKTTPSEYALQPIDRMQPRRTHKAGCDDEGKILDMVSVWGRHGRED